MESSDFLFSHLQTDSSVRSKPFSHIRQEAATVAVAMGPRLKAEYFC